MSIYITATGLYTPPYSISNEELVATFNQFVDNYNAKNAEAIAKGEKTELQHLYVETVLLQHLLLQVSGQPMGLDMELVMLLEMLELELLQIKAIK